MSSENVHIAGRYNKYLRNLSQTPWVDKDDVRIKNSVQELIEDGLKKHLKFDKAVFSSSGREDVDVRMLGKGRPFVFKLVNLSSDHSQEVIAKIQDYINTTYAKQLKIRHLQVVSKESVKENLKEGEESKTKEYRALCCCSKVLTPEDIDKISQITDLLIEQKTPIRVLHRRSATIRRRTIHRMKIDSVKLGDFDSVTSSNIEKVFALTLLTEAGTYIKEFVHGDFGRTIPDLGSLLGDGYEADLMELDVLEVYLDWPPHPPVKNKEEQRESTSLKDHSKPAILNSTNNKMFNSETSLEELYNSALESMKKAESMPRGTRRQDLYMDSMRLFKQASNLVDGLSLFSANETIDDVASVNLKYLLIPAYLAKIAVSSECGPNRLQTFTKAAQSIKSFLQRILNYGLADNKLNLDRLIEQVDDIESFNETFSPSTQSTSLESAMQTRTEKIEKFKRMKLLESHLEELEHRSSLSQKANTDLIDEETIRDYYLTLIKKWVEDTVEMLQCEIKPALFFELNLKPTSSAIVEEFNKPSSDSQPRKTITIVKNDLQKKVFGLGYPSHPTVTVDEFITQKMNSGELAFQTQKEVYANSLQRYAEKPNLLREQEEASDEEHDLKEEKDDLEELQRKRRWDEFKDENPRGSGNRHNMG